MVGNAGKREEKTKTTKNEIKLWEQANVENICHAEDKENEKRRVCIKRSIQLSEPIYSIT